MVETEFDPNQLINYAAGSYHREMFDMPVGEFFLNIYTKFGDDDVMPHDWAITAWAEDKPVVFRNLDGTPSDSWKVQKIGKEIIDFIGDKTDDDETDDEGWN